MQKRKEATKMKCKDCRLVEMRVKEIKDNLIRVYDANNKLRVRMGVW